MRYLLLLTVGSTGCAESTTSDAPDGAGPDGQTAETGLGDTETPDTPVDTGPAACAPALVPLTGTPRAATVVLEPELCDCAVLAISQGLPGLVLTYNQGVGYGQGAAVGGWICAAVEGSPTAEVFQGGAVIAGLAYDQPYWFHLVHPSTGVEAQVRARITSDIQVQLLEQGWLGCP